MKKKYEILLIIGFILIIIFLYAMFIGTSGLVVKEYKITNKNIPTSFHGIKIVHMSDIHYGRTINENRLKHIIIEINKFKPDIVVFTGDFIDKDTKLNNNMKNILINNLKDIKATLGKYAIYGNHDYIFKEYPTIIEEGGFSLLKNSYDFIYNESYEPIFIGGIDSMLEGNPDIDSIMEYYNVGENNEEEEKVLPNYKIILLHEPDYFDEFKDTYDIDLILAG
ncbi:MAG: metallophosphoesterase, partial [Bacilli bacterium]